MKIDISINLNQIFTNQLFLSFLGSIISVFIVYLYKCIFIDNTINKWSYIKIFILNFIINYLILYIYINYKIDDFNNSSINTLNTENFPEP